MSKNVYHELPCCGNASNGLLLTSSDPRCSSRREKASLAPLGQWKRPQRGVTNVRWKKSSCTRQNILVVTALKMNSFIHIFILDGPVKIYVYEKHWYMNPTAQKPEQTSATIAASIPSTIQLTRHD